MFYNVRIKKGYLYGVIIFLILLILVYFLNDQIIQNVFQPGGKDAIYYIDTEEKVVVFTFDVCPGDEYIEDIIEILNRYYVRGTFFMTGKWLKENPEVAAKVVKRHEPGNHSYYHPHLDELSNADLLADFEKFREVSLEALGEETAINYFRPPFGEYDERVKSLVWEEGQTMVLWSIESKDWLAGSIDSMVDYILDNLHPGGIILFRTSSKETVMSLPMLIKAVWGEGYRVIPLSTAIEMDWRGI